MPIFKAKKLILAGDPLQLPPTVLSLDRPANGQEKGKAKTTIKQVIGDKARKGPAVSKDAPEETEEPSASSSSDEADEEGEGSDASSISEHEKTTKPSPSKTTRKYAQKAGSGLRPPRSLETTLFIRLEKMYGSGIKRMLNIQYRYV